MKHGEEICDILQRVIVVPPCVVERTTNATSITSFFKHLIWQHTLVSFAFEEAFDHEIFAPWRQLRKII